MKKHVLLLLMISFFSYHTSNAQLQVEHTSNFWSHVRFGGGVGLSFGNGYFSGTLAPSALYDVNPYTSLGVGINGTYNSNKDFYKSTIIGGSLIGLFNPVRGLQLSTEFEESYVHRSFDNRLNYSDDSYWIPALYLGAGYRAGNVTFGIRYDVLFDNDKSIYSDAWAPFVRVYF